MEIGEGDTGTSKVDLMLTLTPTPEGLRGAWQYATDLWDGDTIERLSRHLGEHPNLIGNLVGLAIAFVTIGPLDEMIQQLKAGGVEIWKGPDADENGKFAWVMDPEGNKVELWEPPAGR